MCNTRFRIVQLLEGTLVLRFICICLMSCCFGGI
uniref:Uncharacterized protein n=1 Tax=Anguilla anguilla TaxID=7936 RepID=A0A0E9VTH2_ANGAN